jgi:putative transposase
MARSASVSDLTDAEWAVREPPMPAAKPGGRPPRHARREVVHAIGSVWRGGIAWRSLPHELPPSAISHPRKRPNKGDTGLRWGQDAERPQAPSAGRHRRPGVAGGRASGGCRGPRWHPGRVGRPPPTGPALRQVWVDMGSQGRLVTWLAETLEVTRAVVQRPRRWVRVPVDPDPPMPSPRPVQPRRGVVDRSFAWLDRYRRLGTDDEQFAATEEAWISPAMTQLMTHRLAQGPPFQTPSKRLHRRC